MSCYGQNAAKSTQHAPTNPPVRQNTIAAVPLPIAQVIQETQGANLVYQFTSNRVLSAEQANRWKTRFPNVYPNLLDISIDPQTQEVEIVLPSTHTSADLNSMIKRFGFSGYQLSN